MTTDGTILMPGKQRQRVQMRPLVAGLAIGAGISAAVLVWLAVADDLDANDSYAWAILVVPAVILSTLGALQSLWWRHKLGGIRYEADVATLRVVRQGAVIHEWRWNDRARSSRGLLLRLV